MLRFVLTLAVCGCIVLHELGHALMARFFKIGTRDITLYPIGGVARLERMSTRPLEELLIALAGPAVNIVLVGLLAPAYVGFFGARLPPGALAEFFFWLIVSNIGLVVFNLIPAFPMDGGRVFRAILSLLFDHVQATEVAFYCGVAFACLLGMLSLLLVSTLPGLGAIQALLLAVIAGFIVFAGRQELNMVRQREALRNAPPIDVMLAEPDAALVLDSGGSGFSGYTWDHRIQALVKWHNGRPVGTYTMPSE